MEATPLRVGLRVKFVPSAAVDHPSVMGLVKLGGLEGCVIEERQELLPSDDTPLLPRTHLVFRVLLDQRMVELDATNNVVTMGLDELHESIEWFTMAPEPDPYLQFRADHVKRWSGLPWSDWDFLWRIQPPDAKDLFMSSVVDALASIGEALGDADSAASSLCDDE